MHSQKMVLKQMLVSRPELLKVLDLCNHTGLEPMSLQMRHQFFL